ncbi:MAG: formyltransferase family protein [Cyanobacteria bacterium J06627_28]
MRIAAIGRTQWLFDSIAALAEQGHDIVLIGTCPAAPEYSVTESDFEDLAKQLKCSFFCDPKINQQKQLALIQAARPDIAISVNWLTLIKQRTIDLFPHGIINAHAGDLPRYRGNAVANWAILSGEPSVVLTLHKMSAALDAGDIVLQKSFSIGSETYVSDVYDFFDSAIAPMFVEALQGLENKTLIPSPQPQDPALALRCFPRRPQDGLIDWQCSATEISRLVRASAEPFAGAYTFFNGEKLVVWRAFSKSLPCPSVGVCGQVIERGADGSVSILTKDGVLVIAEAETLTHGRTLPAKIMTSLRDRLSTNAEDELYKVNQRVSALETQIQQLRQMIEQQKQ